MQRVDNVCAGVLYVRLVMVAGNGIGHHVRIVWIKFGCHPKLLVETYAVLFKRLSWINPVAVDKISCMQETSYVEAFIGYSVITAYQVFGTAIGTVMRITDKSYRSALNSSADIQ